MEFLGEIYSIHAKRALQEGVFFKKRTSAKAIIFDSSGNIAYLKISEGDILTLPGGGLKKDESLIDGLRRECQEEAGVALHNIAPIGYTTEYRAPQDRRKDTDIGRKQDSYYYFAQVEGSKDKPEFSQKEISRGFSLHRDTMEVIIGLYKTSLDTETFESNHSLRVILERDLIVLNQAKKTLSRGGYNRI